VGKGATKVRSRRFKGGRDTGRKREGREDSEEEKREGTTTLSEGAPRKKGCAAAAKNGSNPYRF